MAAIGGGIHDPGVAGAYRRQSEYEYHRRQLHDREEYFEKKISKLELENHDLEKRVYKLEKAETSNSELLKRVTSFKLKIEDYSCDTCLDEKEVHCDCPIGSPCPNACDEDHRVSCPDCCTYREDLGGLF